MTDLDRNLDTARRFYAAMAAGDAAAAVELAAPDVVVTQGMDVPWGGRFVGRAELARFAAGVRAHLDSAVRVRRFLAAGDQVAMLGRTSGRTVRADRPFDVEVMHLLTFRDAGVTALHVVIDVPAISAVLETADAR